MLEIFTSPDHPRVFGRIMASLVLCRKYKVPVLFASFATKEQEQRPSHDLLALLQVLGMTAEESKRALERPMEILKEKERQKGEVREGIRQV